MLEKYHRKICFGTDRFTGPDEPIPAILPYLKEGLSSGKLSQQAYNAIMSGNFLRITA